MVIMYLLQPPIDKKISITDISVVEFNGVSYFAVVFDILCPPTMYSSNITNIKFIAI